MKILKLILLEKYHIPFGSYYFPQTFENQVRKSWFELLSTRAEINTVFIWT